MPPNPIDNLIALSDRVTVALWSPQGRGAVATIKVCGALETVLGRPDLPIPFRAANGRSLDQQPIGRITFGHWGNSPSEEVVVCRTSATELEIHCHGGQAAARRILADWAALNVSEVSWQQQSENSAGLWVTVCQTALTQATTLRTAGILMDQEAAWPTFAEHVVSLAQFGDWPALQNAVTAVLDWLALGLHLIEPFQVVLTGPPNVGKSALLNALVGFQRSVVFDQPGTTRDIVTVETAFDGWPVRLIDTAGLRDDARGLEAQGIQLAREQLVHADLVLQVRDATAAIQHPVSVSAVAGTTTIHVVNKVDLLGESSLSPESDSSAEAPKPILVSAKTGAGIEQLIAEIARQLVPCVPAVGTMIPFRAHQIEWLRELGTAVAQQSAIGVQVFAQRIQPV